MAKTSKKEAWPIQIIEEEIDGQLKRTRERDFRRAGGARSMPSSTMEHVKGMHDMRHQDSIPHSTGEGTVFQKLDRLAREEVRLLKRAKSWASNLKREQERIAQVNLERERLLRAVAPLIARELLEEIPLAEPMPPPRGGSTES